MISKSKNFIYLNEFYADGVLLKTWVGKKIPKDIRRLSRLKGCNLITGIYRDGSYQELEKLK